MLHATSPVLFQSTASASVLEDPANAAWIHVVRQIDGLQWERFARRFHVGLQHLRGLAKRPESTDPILEIETTEDGDAIEIKRALLRAVYSGGPQNVSLFVSLAPPTEQDAQVPPCLADPSVSPPLLREVLAGPGQPPIDCLCLVRAKLGAIAMGLSDSPEEVYALLRRNPTFARACGFLGSTAKKQRGELTSRRLPSESTLEQADTVMTRYGLWHDAAMSKVRDNIQSGVVPPGGVLSFDTSHVVAASGCTSVTPEPTEKTPRPKSHKVGRQQKRCDCGKEAWTHCGHPWVQTDPGAAVVVKGPSRIYWAHKVSIAAVGSIPLSCRVCNYAATHDGKTLPPHLDELAQELPQLIEATSVAAADAAYRGNKEEAARHGLDLIVGITGRKTSTSLSGTYPGIDHFTPSGVPVCREGHAFDFRGRDIKDERFIWQAPDDTEGAPVCAGCPLLSFCHIRGEGRRRHVRTRRADFPQIDWDRPQHQALNRALYAERTGVERAIKRLKVDLGGEHLTRRGASRVQAHMDRRLLVLHLLLDDTS